MFKENDSGILTTFSKQNEYEKGYLFQSFIVNVAISDFDCYDYHSVHICVLLGASESLRESDLLNIATKLSPGDVMKVAIKLGIRKAEIDQCKYDNDTDIVMAMFCLLNKWLQRQPKKADPARHLAEALKEAGLVTLAEQILTIRSRKSSTLLIICVSVVLSVCLAVRPSVHLSVCLSAFLCAFLFVSYIWWLIESVVICGNTETGSNKD